MGTRKQEKRKLLRRQAHSRGEGRFVPLGTSASLRDSEPIEPEPPRVAMAYAPDDSTDEPEETASPRRWSRQWFGEGLIIAGAAVEVLALAAFGWLWLAERFSAHESAVISAFIASAGFVVVWAGECAAGFMRLIAQARDAVALAMFTFGTPAGFIVGSNMHAWVWLVAPLVGVGLAAGGLCLAFLRLDFRNARKSTDA